MASVFLISKKFTRTHLKTLFVRRNSILVCIEDAQGKHRRRARRHVEDADRGGRRGRPKAGFAVEEGFEMGSRVFSIKKTSLSGSSEENYSVIGKRVPFFEWFNAILDA